MDFFLKLSSYWLCERLQSINFLNSFNFKKHWLAILLARLSSISFFAHGEFLFLLVSSDHPLQNTGIEYDVFHYVENPCISRLFQLCV